MNTQAAQARLRQARELLGRAIADSKIGADALPGPLHWAVAGNLAPGARCGAVLKALKSERNPADALMCMSWSNGLTRTGGAALARRRWARQAKPMLGKHTKRSAATVRATACWRIETSVSWAMGEAGVHGRVRAHPRPARPRDRRLRARSPLLVRRPPSAALGDDLCEAFGGVRKWHCRKTPDDYNLEHGDAMGEITTSIIIPAFNEENFLPGLLCSIREYGPARAEIIVVDNGSTDATSQIAAANGAVVIRTSRLSPGCARNLGAERASGDIFVFLDADVVLTSEWQQQWRRSHASITPPAMQITGARCDISQNPSWIERRWFAHLRDGKCSYIGSANLIVSRTLFERLGGFDTRLGTCEDTDFCGRAKKLGALVVPRPGFKVHHEGFPSTISSFIQRERWHGKGDLTTLEHMIRSPVALCSIVFAGLNIFSIAALLLTPIWTAAFALIAAALSALAALSMLFVWRSLNTASYVNRMLALPIMYCYLVGRSLSMWDALTDMRLSKKCHIPTGSGSPSLTLPLRQRTPDPAESARP